jgi:hypothetical protein
VVISTAGTDRTVLAAAEPVAVLFFWTIGRVGIHAAVRSGDRILAAARCADISTDAVAIRKRHAGARNGVTSERATMSSAAMPSVLE